MPDKEPKIEFVTPPNLIPPTKGDLLLAIQNAEQCQDATNNHLMSNLKTPLTAMFTLAENFGWNEERINLYRKAEQTLRLFSTGKIKRANPLVSSFMWVSDGTSYDEDKIIN